MEWPIDYLHYVPGSSSFIEMMRGAMRAMDCAGAKPGENVVISTDTNKIRIAETLAAAAHAVGAVPTIVVITPTGAHGAQLPSPAVAACRESDIFFLPSTFSQTHTDARIQAIQNGARGATMCEVTEDALCVGGILATLRPATGWAASRAPSSTSRSGCESPPRAAPISTASFGDGPSSTRLGSFANPDSSPHCPTVNSISPLSKALPKGSPWWTSE